MKLLTLLIAVLLFNAGCATQTASNVSQANSNQVNPVQTNSAQTNNKTGNDNPDAESGEPMISPATIPDAVVGKPYSVKISIANFKTPIADVSVKDGQMPEGITMKTKGSLGEVAEISGIPTKAGTFQFAVLAWCHGTQVSGETAYRKYMMTVKEK